MEADPIRVVIADDHELFRRGLREAEGEDSERAPRALDEDGESRHLLHSLIWGRMPAVASHWIELAGDRAARYEPSGLYGVYGRERARRAGVQA